MRFWLAAQGPHVPAGYAKLGLVGEFDLVRKILPLLDGFLDLIYHGVGIGSNGIIVVLKQPLSLK